jgi:hypothetical protein
MYVLASLDTLGAPLAPGQGTPISTTSIGRGAGFRPLSVRDCPGYSSHLALPDCPGIPNEKEGICGLGGRASPDWKVESAERSETIPRLWDLKGETGSRVNLQFDASN